MIRIWRTDLANCPLNKRIHFLCQMGNCVYEIIGTLTLNQYRGEITRGECIEGDGEIFYRSQILGWASYVTLEEAKCLYE